MIIDNTNLRDIPGFPLYAVSKDGRVWSKSSRKWLRPGATAGGYLLVVLRQGRKRKSRYLHHLVLETYIGLRPPGTEACHCNGVKTDNHLANLRWDTRSGNEADKKKHNVATFGERHPRAKLTTEDVREIRGRYAAREITQKELGKLFGVSAPQISRICTGKDWAHIRH